MGSGISVGELSRATAEEARIQIAKTKFERHVKSARKLTQTDGAAITMSGLTVSQMAGNGPYKTACEVLSVSVAGEILLSSSRKTLVSGRFQVERT